MRLSVGKGSGAAAAKPRARAVDLTWIADRQSSLRKIGFTLVALFLFLRVTSLHELLAVKLGFNPYILYLVGPPAIACMLLSGGVQRAFRWRQAHLWAGFAVLFCASVIFSRWLGGSARLVSTYLRTEWILLPLLAGLALTWKDFWRLMMTLSAAGFVSVIIGMVFAAQIAGGRNELSFGTMADANDFAAHLIFVLPFVVITLCTPRNILIRAAALLVLLLGIYRILSTGSRGAFVALMVTFVFTFLRASPRQKMASAVLVSALFVALMALLPRTVANRLQSLFQNDVEVAQTDEIAFASRQSRVYLLKRSIALTFKHPLFGVGPGEFADAENADMQQRSGRRGAWHVTHNAYTQVSSEAGVPAALFFIAAIGSTLLLINRVHRIASRKPPSMFRDRVLICSYCLLVSAVGFSAASFFLSLAYLYYFPALTGLAIVLAQAVEHEWKVQEEKKAAAKHRPERDRNPASAQPVSPRLPPDLTLPGLTSRGKRPDGPATARSAIRNRHRSDLPG